MTDEDLSEDEGSRSRHWYQPEPGQLVGPGHRVGDLVGAPQWRVLERAKDYLLVSAPLPEHALNPRGQLFGGFTGVFCDFMAIFVTRQTSADTEPQKWKGWMATRDMRIEYLRPVFGPTLRMEGRALHRGRKDHLIEIKFLDDHDQLLVLAHVKMVDIPGPPPDDPMWADQAQ